MDVNFLYILKSRADSVGLKWSFNKHTAFFFFFFLPLFFKALRFFVFNWRIIALQYCVGFCYTSTCRGFFTTYTALLLAVLGLRCCTWAFSNGSAWALLFVAVRTLLIAVASFVEHGLQGTWASVVMACRL